MANAVTLDEFLTEATVGEFRPEPIYEKYTDSLIFYARNVRSYAKRLNALMTVFLAADDDSLVGIEIKGITGLLKRTAGILAVASDGKHTIALSALVACALAPEPELEDEHVIAALQQESKKWPEINTEEFSAIAA